MTDNPSSAAISPAISPLTNSDYKVYTPLNALARNVLDITHRILVLDQPNDEMGSRYPFSETVRRAS